ncbi:MAG: PASTA domain-containing protein [Bacilli bacterium]|nr:PASTA domain-containing protein [Bacilli bacterium]
MKKNNKKNNNLLLLLIPLILGIGYLGYTIFIAQNKLDHIYTIINGSILSLIIIIIGVILYTKNEITKKITSIVIIILILLIVDINVGTSLGFIKLPKQDAIKDYKNKNVIEVVKWTTKHNIDLKQIQEFSDTIDENLVISQSKKEHTLAKHIKQLEVIVSKGPNPDTKVELKNMVGNNIDEVLKEIKKLKLSNIEINYTFSSIEKDQVIKQNVEGTINRNDQVIFEVSLGEEENLEPVKLIDLANKNKFDATLWLKRNGIKYEIKYEFSKNIKKDSVISTNPKKGTLINQKEMTVELILSKGKKITVPDLEKLSLNEIIDWASKNKINIKYNSEYDSTIKKGKIKYISCKKGDSIEEGSTIYITTSKGTLKMIDYTDQDIDKIRTFANTYNIAINENMEYSKTVEKGKLISVSHKKGDVINSQDTIEVVISLGKSITVPDFTGMTLSKAKSVCAENKLDCTSSYIDSTKTKNTVIRQNKKANSEVVEGTNVVLYISNEKKNSSSSNNNTTNNNKNNNSSNSNSNTTNNNTNNNQTNTNQCDTSKTTILNIQVGSNGEETKSMINNMNKGIKFSWNMVTSCPNGDTTPGTVCNGNTLDGKRVDYCNTISVTIVK